MSGHDLKEYLSTAQSVARAAGQIIRDAFSKKRVIMEKDDIGVDLVTETDQKCEQLILQSLKEKYPSHGFIGEESTAAGAKNTLTDNPTWIVDPLDGTTNFIHSFPYVAVCIALAIDQKVQVGVVYNPIHDEMYAAARGHGAFLNNEPLKVSPCTSLTNALVHTELGSARSEDKLAIVKANYFAIATAPCHSIRSLGAAAMNMAMVARGCSDAYWEFGVHAWDYAAPSVIVEEAGGYCCDTTGGPLDLMARKVVAASTKHLAEAMVAKLTEIPYERD